MAVCMRPGHHNAHVQAEAALLAQGVCTASLPSSLMGSELNSINRLVGLRNQAEPALGTPVIIFGVREN